MKGGQHERKAQAGGHDQLDQLRQATANERVKQRVLDAQKDAAKLKVASAGAAITEAYAAEDGRLVAKRRKDLEAAKTEVLDLEHRVAAAGLRVQRAQAEADNFQAEHAHELLDEKEPASHARREPDPRRARGRAPASGPSRPVRPMRHGGRYRDPVTPVTPSRSRRNNVLERPTPKKLSARGLFCAEVIAPGPTVPEGKAYRPS